MVVSIHRPCGYEPHTLPAAPTRLPFMVSKSGIEPEPYT